MTNITVNVLFTDLIPLPAVDSGATLTLTIRKASGGTLAGGTFTFLAGIQWKLTFTPATENEVYAVEVADSDGNIVFSDSYKACGALVDETTGASGSDLTTLAHLREYLKKQTADTTDDPLLQSIITRVSKEIETRCNRAFAAATYTEYYAGNGSNKLYVKNAPINSVTSIHVDDDREWDSDSAIDAADIIISSEYPGMIILDDGELFIRNVDGIENVRVIYNGGYTTIPYDLEQACIEICSCRYLLSGGMVNSPAKGAISPQEVEDQAWERIVRKYRNITL